MNVIAFKTVEEEHFNCFGERALPYAPKIELADGSSAVPQQFIEVQRDLASVEKILAEISLPDDYLLFAGQIDSVVFLQVGAIGCENYPAGSAESEKSAKIVYGRRWLLEPTTPTSEVIQTAYLAVKKVREHELREHIFWLSKKNQQGKMQRATPFNSHLDLPLMAQHRADMYVDEQLLMNSADVTSLLTIFRVASYKPELFNMSTLANGEALFQLKLVLCDVDEKSDEAFPELLNQSLSFVCRAAENEFLHALFASVLQCSDRYVEQQFAYQGFARFSTELSVQKKADFSFLTRNPKAVDARFKSHFDDMSYEVDASKAPSFNRGALGEKQHCELKAYDDLQGYLPLDV